MAFDINAEIREVEEKVSRIKDEQSEIGYGKTFQMFKEIWWEGKLNQLKAIRDRRFKVSIKLVIHCDTFGSRDFDVAEFDLTDEFTTQCAMKNYRKYSVGTKNSLFV